MKASSLSPIGCTLLPYKVDSEPRFTRNCGFRVDAIGVILGVHDLLYGHPFSGGHGVRYVMGTGVASRVDSNYPSVCITVLRRSCTNSASGIRRNTHVQHPSANPAVGRHDK